MTDHDRCRYCREPVLWLRSASTNRLAPIDAHPTPDGNIAVDGDAGVYIVLTGKERERFDATTHDRDARPSLHTNHFATCRNATAVRLARERAARRRVLTGVLR